MSRHIDRLRELTETARLAGSLADGTGRYARTPDYTKPAAPSSRPKSDRGSTFHFAHKSMSKGNDMSDSNFTHTTSAAHQGYIERPSATEEISPDIRSTLKNAPMPELDVVISEGFSYPQRVVDPYRASFGTLGTTKAKRKEFWNEVERHEGSKGRVQSRIIAELPVELSPERRCLAARDFCQSFEERGLPYWATLHAPGKRNDHRNFHLHITYFDRPTGQDSAGNWAHTKTERRKKKSGNYIEVHPFRSNKHPDTRLRDWPKRLRRNYSDTCNFHLAADNHDKRYDPRSYRDSGIQKEPTEHLGNKLSALESMGLETNSGQRNAKREIRWIFAKAEKPWKDRAKQLQASDAFGSPQLKDQQSELVHLAETGISHARKAASLDIASNLITTRMSSRKVFLDEEIRRLNQKDDLSDLARRTATIISLSAERDLLDERSPALQKAAKKCKGLGFDEMKKSKKKIRQFDHNMMMFDPDALLSSDSLDGFENIEELAPEVNELDGLDNADLSNIDDLFSDLKNPDPETSKDVSRTETVADEAAQDKKSVTSEPQGKPVSRIEEIIRSIAGQDPEAKAEGSEKFDADAFPDAWSIQPTKDKEDLAKLDQKLAKLDNKDLRQAAIASRDATDLCATDSVRDEFNRGWAVLRYEAERRGLDLDTGMHRPETATDVERAQLHSDQDPCPIRIVRKNIARQRVRG